MGSTSDIAAKLQSLKSKGLNLGIPTGPEQDAGTGGRVQAFQGGRIYWTPLLGAHEVHGAILAKYLQMGGPGNHPVTGKRELGFPRSDEKQTPEGFARVSEFEFGAIYFGYDAGAVPLYGPIYTEWSTKYPLASVVLGFPLIEPFMLPGNIQAAIFSNGFSFTFGPQNAVSAGNYQGPMPGKPAIVTLDTRDLAGFDISLPLDVFSAIQKQAPNLLTDIWKDRLVLQRVNNKDSLIPLVVEPEPPVITGGTLPTGGKVPGGPRAGVHLKIKVAPGSLMVDRSLYNIAVRTPGAGAAAIAMHAIYARKDWDKFGILHATDIHVTGRADAIFSTLRGLGRNESAEAFNNTNDGFRDFIRYANHLHDKNLVDLIVATGDLVDYQYEGDGNTVNDLGGSFLLFEKIMRGASPSPRGTPVEELRVPIFTTLGNHDYRKIEYGLLFDVDIPVHKDLEVRNFDAFNLTRSDVQALEGDKPTISSDAAVAQVRVKQPHHYFKRINTVVNDGSSYLVRLGPNHRIVILDSQHDIGIIEGEWDAFKVTQLGIGGEDKTSFADGAPNQVGVTDRHLSLLSQALTEAGGDGVVITGIHGPPINIKGAEFAPYFRESEHPFADKKDVIAFLIRQSPDSFSAVPLAPSPVSIVSDQIKITDWDVAEDTARRTHPGWMNNRGEPFFMSGTVDDLLDRDVSKGRMDDFLKMCAGVSVPGLAAPRPVDLVLCGHGHNRVEYRVRFDTVGNRMLYFMDFYTENPDVYYGMLKGSFDFGNKRMEVLIRPGAPFNGAPENNIQDQRWEGEELTVKTPPFGDPLNAAHDKAAWWAQHRPLLVQTAALGPIGSGSNDRREPGKRKPNPIFQGFRLITVSGKNISSIRYLILPEVRAHNFEMPFEKEVAPGSPLKPIGGVVVKQ